MPNPTVPDASQPTVDGSSVVSGIESPARCYFMVADILGFSRMMKNLDGDQQAQRILEWVDVAQHAGCQAGVEEQQLISDTLFAREEDSAVLRKAAETKLMPAISWKVPSTDELLRKISDNGLMAEGDRYKWDVVSKLERTIQFGIYLKIGRAHGLDPQRYNFWFPMHMIERALET